MGFELVGGGGSGVAVQSGHSNVCVRNGTLRGWSGNGVSADQAFSSRFEALQLVGNRNLAGISVGRGCIVTHCIAINNDNYGIEARPGSLVSHCVAWQNLLGIYVGPGGRVTDCTSISNTLTGIWADSGSTVSDCTVSANMGDGILARNGCRVTASHSFGNGSAGIRVVGSGSTIADCTVSTNASDGISVTNGCRVAMNHCYDNGSAGIRVTGSESAIENNVLIANQRGIWIDRVDGRNLVVRNVARNNILGGVGNRNYDIATGNRVAQTVILPFNAAALTGETGGNASGTTDPWSNMSY
jgi:parallel beta-helix repeat protein